MDSDIRQIDSIDMKCYYETVVRGALSDAFWETVLPQALNTSSTASPYFRAFEAAQVKANDRGFLSKDITVRELIEVKSDIHHVFPRSYLKAHGLARSLYNQVANYVVAQSEINISIGAKEPRVYFAQLLEQCAGGQRRYGNITNADELRENLLTHCIPDGIEHMTVADYPSFLAERRRLMASKIRAYFEGL